MGVLFLKICLTLFVFHFVFQLCNDYKNDRNPTFPIYKDESFWALVIGTLACLFVTVGFWTA